MESYEIEMPVEYLHEDMEPLTYQHINDGGADCYMYQDTVIKHGENRIPLGFKFILPKGTVGYVYPRSSVMGVNIIHNTAPIDAGYSGQWHLIINNLGEEFTVKKNERICQIVIQPILQNLSFRRNSVIRTNNGIGSTGK